MSCLYWNVNCLSLGKQILSAGPFLSPMENVLGVIGMGHLYHKISIITEVFSLMKAFSLAAHGQWIIFYYRVC